MSDSGAQTYLEEIQRVAGIISAYVEDNVIATKELPDLIASVHQTLRELGTVEPEPEPQEPAVSIGSSVKRDSIACLECGQRLKSLKRHLSSRHDLTPAKYREKWKLKSDYPMVAPNYAEARSKLAKAAGLGRKAKK